MYTSIFGPDPTEYRAERGLLDVHEEMGIMIQEVVGQTAGKYFLPACSGVAFSNNEFRWSARIKRDDGLIRLVPGLGTRAVDRVADDYPVLIARQVKSLLSLRPQSYKPATPVEKPVPQIPRWGSSADVVRDSRTGVRFSLRQPQTSNQETLPRQY